MAGERKLTLELAVDDQGSIKIAHFNEQIKRTSGSVDSMSRSLTLIKWDSIMNLGQRALNAARQMDQLATSVASGLNEIKRMAEISGMSTDEFQAWKYAAKMADVEAETLAVGIKLLSRNMAEGDKAFAAMGVNIKEMSTGALRPLSDVIKDVMDKFKGYEDGAGKVALATQLFGRSGEQLIPFLNRGSRGFQELADEAQRLGIILDPKLIAAGSAAEDSLKKMNAQIDAQKLKLEPLVEVWIRLKSTFLSILEPFANAFKILREIRESRIEPEYRQESRYLGAWGAKGGKVAPPASSTSKDAGKPYEQPITFHYSKWADDLKSMEAYDKYLKDFDTGWKEFTADILEADNVTQEFMTHMNTSGVVVTDSLKTWNEQIQNFREEWKGFVDEDKTVQKFSSSIKGTFTEKEMEAMKKTSDFWGGTVESMANSFTSGFENVLIHGFDNIGDAFKDLGKMMLGELIKITGQLLINQALYGSMQGAGGFSSGGAFGGLFGLLGMAKMQEGGIVTRPTIAMIGEKGPEAVIPLSKGGSSKGGGDTYNVFNITAWDAKGVSHWLRHGGARQIAGGLKGNNQIAGSRANMI